MPEGQEARLTIAEPSEKHKNKHKDTCMFTEVSHSKANHIFAVQTQKQYIFSSSITHVDAILSIRSLQCRRHDLRNP